MRTLYAFALLTLTGSAFAQAPAAAPADPFIGSVSLGYLATTGNTDSKNANASMKATWDLDGPWKHDWNALAINARTNGITTAESYSAGYKALRDFSDKSYLFFTGDWRQDQFAGYDRQVSETIGYGRRLLDSERQMLALEGGAGAKQTDVVTGEALDEAIVRGAIDYILHISESSEFNQKLLIEQGDENRYTESTSALKARLIGNIALVLSLVIKQNSDVPVGIEGTDRFTSIPLEYAF